MFRNSWLIFQARPIRETAIGAALALSFLLAGSAWAGDIRITNAAAHLNNDRMNGHRIAIYLDIENIGGGDRLYAVRSDISGKAMLSVSGAARGGAQGMEQASMEKDETLHHRTAALEVPASKVVRLEKGGAHIMLMNPGRLPATGATFPITLFFEKAGRITVDVVMESIEFAQQPLQ